jgi:hypothetical protein
VDRRDLQLGEGLAMAALAMRVLAALLLEGDDLLALALFEDLGRDRGAGDERRAGLGRLSPPSISTSPSVSVAPTSPSSFSTVSTSSLATVYCLPPVRMTANMEILEIPNSWQRPRSLPMKPSAIATLSLASAM